MLSIFKCLIILTPTDFVVLQCFGQFFRISGDDPPIRKGEPFLSTDVFDCGKQESCDKLLRSGDPYGEDFASNYAMYTIRKTKDPSAKYPSCEMAIKANDNKEEYYNIQHGKMLHSIEVECKVINKTTYAIIHHDSEETREVHGYEAPGSFRKQVKYVVHLKDVAYFVDSSISCSQLTRFDCHHSLLHSNAKIYTYVVDRNNVSMPYIGGGPIHGKGCECGIKNRCAKNGTVCNCDKNDFVWRYDSGLVTEKSRLPLTAVRIGDTGHTNEMIRYTIGTLNCKSEE